jgi:hypothetical protein
MQSEPSLGGASASVGDGHNRVVGGIDFGH